MLKLAILVFGLSFSSLALADAEHWDAKDLHASKECLLKVVRNQMYSKKQSVGPQLKVESETPLSEFQDSVEKSWSWRPENFLNVFVAKDNTIFLMSKRSSYKAPRTAVDSLVHELVHFVQHADFDGATGDEDYMEQQAVNVQTWFRENRGALIIDEKYQGPCE